MTDEHCACCARPPRPGAAGLCALHQRRKLRSEPMTQPHDLVGQIPSGYGLLGIVERDETGRALPRVWSLVGGLTGTAHTGGDEMPVRSDKPADYGPFLDYFERPADDAHPRPELLNHP